MQRKNLIHSLALTVLLSNAAYAWDGSFLIGLSGGWAERDGQVNATITHPLPGLPTTTFINGGDSNFDNGYLWGLLAGYELTNNAWIIGFEANLDWQDKRHKLDDNILAFTDNINQGWMYTPHFKTNAVLAFTGRVGYQLFTYFIPYVRLGPEFSSNRFRFYAYDPVQGLFAEGDSKRHMVRAVVGAGAQLPIPFVMTGLSLRAEYNYHSRGKSIDSEGLARPDYATLWNANTKVSTNSFKASIVWNLPI